MFKYVYTILNPNNFTIEQIENGTLYGLEPILNLGQDWWDNQRMQVANSISEGNLIDYQRRFYGDRVETIHYWDTVESKEEYDNNINISAILDRLEEIGYTVSVDVTEI